MQLTYSEFIFNNPVLSELNKLLLWGSSNDCNDVFLISDEPVWVKRNNVTFAATKHAIPSKFVKELLENLQTNMTPYKLIEGQPSYFSYKVLNQETQSMARFRVAATGVVTNNSYAGVEINFRVLKDKIPTVDELKIEQDIIDAFTSKRGIALVTGATESGKTTFIASLVQYLAQKYPEHILGIENPVEYYWKSIPNRIAKTNQSEVPIHLKNYNQALQNLLRRNPDRIMYGEARSKEEFQLLSEAALSGHFVCCTVHTNSVEDTIPRMIEAFDIPEQPAAAAQLLRAIRVIIHQQLVPDVSITEGRTAIRSYVVLNETMRRSLLAGFTDIKQLPELIHTLVLKHGKTTLHDLREKFEAGQVDVGAYVGLLKEIGAEREYYDVIPDVARTLNQKGVIRKDTCDNWIAISQEVQID